MEIEKSKVVVHRENALKFENAYYVSKIMISIRKFIIQKTKRHINFDSSIYNLKDLQISSIKIHNWEVVVSELKKFGIRVTKE